MPNDAAIIAEAQRLRAAIDAARGAGAREREAKRALGALRRETDTRGRLPRTIENARNAADMASMTADAARRAVYALARLKGEHPELLRQLPAATLDDVE